MKYYCENCETKIILNGKDTVIFANGGIMNPEEMFDGLCPICDEEMAIVSDYETPEQYKKRTGKAYSEDGLVWVRGKWINNGTWGKWETTYLKHIGFNRSIVQIVIADSPIPPPDNWKSAGVTE